MLQPAPLLQTPVGLGGKEHNLHKDGSPGFGRDSHVALGTFTLAGQTGSEPNRTPTWQSPV